MTRLIDAESIPWDVDGVGEIPVITKEEIDDMPTVDAVPVIRCKDCKYFTRDTITGVTIPGSEYCIFTMNNRIEEDDFCSRAERKEE